MRSLLKHPVYTLGGRGGGANLSSLQNGSAVKKHSRTIHSSSTLPSRMKTSPRNNFKGKNKSEKRKKRLENFTPHPLRSAHTFPPSKHLILVQRTSFSTSNFRTWIERRGAGDKTFLKMWHGIFFFSLLGKKENGEKKKMVP